jgi:exonuclease III
LALKSLWQHIVWYNDGVDDSYRGVAVFSRKYEIGFTENFNRNFRYVIPYKIKGYSPDLELFVVWTKEEPLGYEKTLFEALKYYKPSDRNTIIIGDFNTFAKDDNGLKKLEEKMLPLVNCAKEAPLKPTYYHTKDNMGVDDFCFASGDLAANAELEVCDDDTVKKLSDHYPIVVDFS